jgi:hypothetical protein
MRGTNARADPNTSEEAKAHAREILEAHDYSYERPADVTEDEHDRRVLGGYKAALNSAFFSPDRVQCVGLIVSSQTRACPRPRRSTRARCSSSTARLSERAIAIGIMKPNCSISLMKRAYIHIQSRAIRVNECEICAAIVELPASILV